MKKIATLTLALAMTLPAVSFAGSLAPTVTEAPVVVADDDDFAPAGSLGSMGALPLAAGGLLAVAAIAALADDDSSSSTTTTSAN